MNFNIFVSIFIICIIRECITLAIASKKSSNLFVNLCFLPKTTIQINITDLTYESGAYEPYYTVLGNNVMQMKMSRILTERDDVSKEELELMCLVSKLDGIDADNQTFFGQFFGFEETSSNFTCTSSKDLVGIEICKFESCFNEFSEDTLSYFSVGTETGAFEIDCFKNGEVGWALYSKYPKLSDEDKKFFSDHAASLGFPTDTTVTMYGDKCGSE